jgi:hypothetical protein
MTVQAAGKSQSGGLNEGCLSWAYQTNIFGWFGDGVVDALMAIGKNTDIDAISAAAAEGRRRE